MEMLKIYTNFVEDMEELSDEERGRLFTMMLKYASDGEEIPPKGNEKYLWSHVRKLIRTQRENYEEMCQRNKKIATTRYDSSRLDTTRHDSCEEKEKDKDKDKKKMHKRKNRVVDGYAQTPLGNVDHMVVLDGGDHDQ